MAEPFIGQIVLFAGCYYPEGWAPCFGQLLEIQAYPTLFLIIGTTYGGDGLKTFQLPDLRGRTPIGTGQVGNSPNIASGSVGGQQSLTLTLANIPAHTHPLNVCSTDAASSNPQGAYLATAVEISGGSANFVYGSNPNATANAGTIGPAGGTAMGIFPPGPNGTIQPITIQPPYVGMNYIIALTGAFPKPSEEFPSSSHPSASSVPNLVV